MISVTFFDDDDDDASCATCILPGSQATPKQVKHAAAFPCGRWLLACRRCTFSVLCSPLPTAATLASGFGCSCRHILLVGGQVNLCAWKSTWMVTIQGTNRQIMCCTYGLQGGRCVSLLRIVCTAPCTRVHGEYCHHPMLGVHMPPAVIAIGTGWCGELSCSMDGVLLHLIGTVCGCLYMVLHMMLCQCTNGGVDYGGGMNG